MMIDYYNGVVFEGPLSTTAYQSFVALLNIEIKQDDSAEYLVAKINGYRDNLESLRVTQATVEQIPKYEAMEQILDQMRNTFFSEETKRRYEQDLLGVIAKNEAEHREKLAIAAEAIRQLQQYNELTEPNSSMVPPIPDPSPSMAVQTASQQAQLKKTILTGLGIITLVAISLIFNMSIQVIGISILVMVALMLLLA